MDFNVILFLLFIGAPLSILIHELGHALASLYNNAAFITIDLGSGREMFAKKIGRIKVVIRLFYFLGGSTKNSRNISFSKREIFWISISGPFFSGCAAILLLIIVDIIPTAYVSILFWFNVWLAIGNLFPIRINERKTDGYTILEILKQAS